ncbi:MAG TPA: class I SAM-dependent methyltransferase [Anaerolineae bacterium]|nr:class I SAM-dependent methyltransferase [Anaerolineae bacterium]HQI83587.1 class I SAM-dependent methyltransferase [Anaerolineae bacterium]
MDATQAAAQHWDEQPEWNAGCYWLELPTVQRRLNQRATGDPAEDWIQYTLRRYFPHTLPLARCLSLGCGKGALERRLADLNAFVACDAVDIAPACIAAAQARAAQAGYTHIHYTVADLNTLPLEPSTYDLVLGNGSVHHLEALEAVFARVAQALKPGGLFVLNEYVGPSRFQFPPRQKEIIQACWTLLPPAYRQPLAAAVAEHQRVATQRRSLAWSIRRLVEKARDGDLLATAKRRWTLLRGKAQTGLRFPSASDVAATDPSEAVRSADILPALERDFEIVEVKPLGGTILQFLLADIAGNFRTPEGERLLAMLFAIEDALLAAGEVESDFVYVVARVR